MSLILPPLSTQEPQTHPPTPIKPNNHIGETQTKPSPIPALMSLKLPPQFSSPCPSEPPPTASFLSQDPPQLSQSPSPPLLKKEYLKIGCWNVQGWGRRIGSNTREHLVTNLNLDILCLCETFLVGKQEVQLSNYIWYGNKTICRRAVRGSGEGGGGDSCTQIRILQHFTVQVLDDSFEDILWAQLMDNNGSCVTCVCVCYLPPAKSSRGDTSTEFLTASKHR